MKGEGVGRCGAAGLLLSQASRRQRRPPLLSNVSAGPTKSKTTLLRPPEARLEAVDDEEGATVEEEGPATPGGSWAVLSPLAPAWAAAN